MFVIISYDARRPTFRWPSSCRCWPLAGEHPDPDVPVVEVVHQVDEMAEIATEAIEPPDDDHVSLPRRLEEGGEPRAVLTLSGRLVLVDRVVADAGPRAEHPSAGRGSGNRPPSISARSRSASWSPKRPFL